MNDAVRQHTLSCSSPCGEHRIAYREWGDAECSRVLVCVHGLSRNGRDFDVLARALAAEYRVVCPDLVGRGRSDWLRDPSFYRVEQYVADLGRLVAALGAANVHWVGTSLGGIVGMVMASLATTPIAKLVLNDVGPVIAPQGIDRIGANVGRAPDFASVAEAEAYLRLVNAPFGELADSAWRALTESSLRERVDGRFEMRCDPEIAGPFHRATSAPIDLWPIYDRLRCPTLVLRGAQSDLLSAATADAMAKRGPLAQVVEIEGVGHAPMLMNEAQIALVRRFLLDARAAPDMAIA
jgi:pimeloyl-ACP methyl ester carboxylesterase